MEIHKEMHSSILCTLTFVVQALYSYNHVPEQDGAAFIFHVLSVLPGVVVGVVVKVRYPLDRRQSQCCTLVAQSPLAL